MKEPKYIKQWKGDYRVQYWSDVSHNTYCYEEEREAITKYMELVMRQAMGTMRLNLITFEVLYDYGGDDKLAFRRVLEAKRVG